MKKLVLTMSVIMAVITLLLPQLSKAQAPDAIKYQAVARDASGEVMANQQVEITIAILQGDVNGTEIFTETHTLTTNAYGLVSLNIGAVNPIDFAAIQWANGPYFVQVSMDGNVMGVSQLLSVPYAKYADEAGNTFSGSFNDLADLPTNIDLDATDDFSGDYIDLINTPTIPVDISDLSDNSSLLFDGDYNSLSNLPTLFSGSYQDLTGKPAFADSVSMYGFSGSFTDLSNMPPNLDTDATDDFSGNFNDLFNTPIIPTDVADLSDNSSLLFDGDYNSLTNPPTLFSGNYMDLSNKPVISDSIFTYGFSGSYNDLADVPVNIDTDVTDDFDGDYNSLINQPDLSVYTITDTTLTEAEVDAMANNNGYAMQVAIEDTAANIRADLASVATSGDYTDLVNTPDLSDTANYAMQTALEDTASNLRNDMAEKNNVLALDNTKPFTPDADYEPATKKYVDDNSGLKNPVSAVFVDKLTRNITNVWVLGPTFSEVTGFNAGSKVKISYSVPSRTQSTGYNGLYIEPQISFDNGASWVSLGSSGYDGNSMSTAVIIGTYTNVLLIDPGLTSDFSVKFRFYYKSYNNNVVNGSHDINNVSGTATLMSGINGEQHYTKVIIEEVF